MVSALLRTVVWYFLCLSLSSFFVPTTLLGIRTPLPPFYYVVVTAATPVADATFLQQQQPQQHHHHHHQQQQHEYRIDDVECILYKQEIQVTQQLDEEEYVCLFVSSDAKKNQRRSHNSDATTMMMLVPLDYGSLEIKQRFDAQRIRSGAVKMTLSHAIATAATTTTTTTAIRTTSSSTDVLRGGDRKQNKKKQEKKNTILISSLFIPTEAQIIFSLEEDTTTDNEQLLPQHHHPRNLAVSSTGRLNTLVVRVIDAEGVGPSPSKETMCDEIFRHPTTSVRAQYQACSYNQLRIAPAAHISKNNSGNNSSNTTTTTTTTPGVIEIQVPTVRMADRDVKRKTLVAAAMLALQQYVNNMNTSLEDYDLIMVCFPPGSVDPWLAYAVLNSKFSYYNDVWCRSLSAKMVRCVVFCLYSWFVDHVTRPFFSGLCRRRRRRPSVRPIYRWLSLSITRTSFLSSSHFFPESSVYIYLYIYSLLILL